VNLRPAESPTTVEGARKLLPWTIWGSRVASPRHARTRRQGDVRKRPGAHAAGRTRGAPRCDDGQSRTFPSSPRQSSAAQWVPESKRSPGDPCWPFESWSLRRQRIKKCCSGARRVASTARQARRKRSVFAINRGGCETVTGESPSRVVQPCTCDRTPRLTQPSRTSATAARLPRRPPRPASAARIARALTRTRPLAPLSPGEGAELGGAGGSATRVQDLFALPGR
jgi:hypothetical protein